MVTMGRRVPASSAVAAAAAAAVVMVVCGWGAGVARGDFATDQAECAEALVGLSTCLTYVEGSAKAPTPDCCTGLKQVIGKSPKCLCILIKDRDNPQLGFKIDATRAMSLPGVCSVPANISHCPRLLKLDPNSKDAEVFKQFGTAPKQGNATSSSNIESGVPSSSSSPGSSGGGGDKAKDSSGSGAGGRSHFLLGQQRWLRGVEVTGGLWVSCVLALSLGVMLGG